MCSDMTSLGFHYNLIEFIIQCQYAIVPFCVGLLFVEVEEHEEEMTFLG